ncbi:MAG: SGNH/GDSL hydrolase family protein [Planctomycetales bacterium]
MPYYRATHLAFALGNLAEQVRVRWFRSAEDEMRDVLLTDDALHHLEYRAERVRLLKERPLHEPPAELPMALDRFREDFTDLIRACRERGLPVLVLTQPCLYSADMPPELSYYIGWTAKDGAYPPDVLERIIDEFNRVALEVCAAEQVDSLDLAAMVSKDLTTFCDDFHFNISGNEKTAEIVADYFVKRARSL